MRCHRVPLHSAAAENSHFQHYRFLCNSQIPPKIHVQISLFGTEATIISQIAMKEN